MFVICVLLAFNAAAISFTADAIQVRGAEVRQAKMFGNDGSIRFEYMDLGIPMVQIFDKRNKQVIWLDAEKKVFMQRDLSEHEDAPVMAEGAKKYDPCAEFPQADCAHLKSTELNGRNTDKWLITLNKDGRDLHVFQWVDKQHQILARQENPDGSVLDMTIFDSEEYGGRTAHKVDMIATAPDGSRVEASQWYDTELGIVVRQRADDGAVNELRNIRVGPIRADMFSVPEGYSSIESQLSGLNTTVTTGTTDN